MSKAAADRIFGSYIFINYANKGKLEKINQVLTEYRKTAKDIAIYLWDIFFRFGKLRETEEILKSLNAEHVKIR